MTYKTHITMALAVSTSPFLLTMFTNDMTYLNNIVKILTYNSEYFLKYHNLYIDSDKIKTLIVLFLTYIFILIGSLMPDLDHKDSKISKFVKTKKIYLLIFLYILFKFDFFDIKINLEYDLIKYLKIIDTIFSTTIIFIVLKYIGQKFKHRGPTHSILLQILIFGVLIVIFEQIIQYKWINFILINFLIGSVLHVIADMFTKQGVAIFYPINNIRYTILPKSFCIQTNSNEEFKYHLLPYSILLIINLVIIFKTI